MGFYDAIRVGASGAAADFTVDRSLRFNSADTAYLNRTPSNASNRKTWTWSSWIKREQVSAGTSRYFFMAGQADGNDNVAHISFDTNDRLRLYGITGSFDYKIRTNSVFRDFSAWYHVVVAFDTTQATASNRIKFYVNGVQITDLGQSDYPSQNHDSYFNNNVLHNIGRYNAGSTQWFQGYMAEINFIDGFQYDPSYFGETDAITGQWNPKKYVGSYGTNGFYLNFSDNSGTTATTLGKDSSGNGNNFTPNNFSVSAGTGNDSLEDTPTNNFATLNSLNFNGNSPSNGNLQSGTAGTTGWRHTYATFAMPSSGKWYWEVTRQGGSIDGSNGICYGLADSVQVELTRDINSNSNNLYLRQNDSRYNNGTITGSHFAAPSVGNVIQFAFDADTGSMWSGVNNTWTGANPSTGSSASWTSIPSGMVPLVGSYGSNNYSTINFGQQGFTYTPPTGYKALSSANLPDPTILLPDKHFDTLLYTGSDSSSLYNVTGLEFQPDWVWGKSRNDVIGHILFDAVRGEDKQLEANLTDAEVVRGSAAYRFLSNGFAVSTVGNLNNPVNYVAWNWNAGDTDGKTYTVKVVSDSGNKYRFDDFGTSAVTLDLAEGGTYIFDQSDSSNSGHPLRFSTTSDGTHGSGSEYTTGVTTAGTPGSSGAYTQIVVAASAPTLYYYCTNHSGMGGQANTNSTLGSSNFDGSVQTVVKANPTAGFSIINFTPVSGTYTNGHGLGVAPELIIGKSRTTTGGPWYVFTTAIDGGIDYLSLNSTAAAAAAEGFGMAVPTSTVITNDSDFTYSSGTMIQYCFSSVAGYSKVGTYKGNNTADGPFVFTGFRPAWIMIKSTSTGGSATYSWSIVDSTRSSYNIERAMLLANVNDSEITSNTADVDLLSNGFKPRYSPNNTNGNNTYIYLAFAEAPFKNARAR